LGYAEQVRNLISERAQTEERPFNLKTQGRRKNPSFLYRVSFKAHMKNQRQEERVYKVKNEKYIFGGISGKGTLR